MTIQNKLGALIKDTSCGAYDFYLKSVECSFFKMLKGFQNTRWHTNVEGKNAIWPSDYELSIKQRSF